MKNLIGILISAFLLLAVMPQVEVAQASQVEPVTYTTYSTVTPSLTRAELIQKGARIYNKYLATLVTRYIKWRYQYHDLAKAKVIRKKIKQTYMGLTSGQKRAVKAYLKSGKPQSAGSVSLVSSEITRTSISTSSMSCWDWTIRLRWHLPHSVIATPDGLPDALDIYRFELYNSFCSEGGVITSFYTRPKITYTMPLFVSYQGIRTQSTSNPLLGRSSTSYFIQFGVSIHVPVIGDIAKVVELTPWISLTVFANGNGTFEASSM